MQPSELAYRETRHARAGPGHPRLNDNRGKKIVDGRDKPGHDEEIG
jgi:hypothetical protein